MQGVKSLAISENKGLTCRFGGALGGTRTPNLLIRSQMLYPLSYERWCLASLRHSQCPVYQPDPTPRLIDSGVRDMVGRHGEQADSRTSPASLRIKLMSSNVRGH